MPFEYINKLWTFTSSGTSSTRVECLGARNLTFHITSAAGSTGGVQVLAFADTKSTSVGQKIGSSASITSSGGTTTLLQFSGPFAGIAPRVTQMTASGTITVRLVAN